MSGVEHHVRLTQRQIHVGQLHAVRRRAFEMRPAHPAHDIPSMGIRISWLAPIDWKLGTAAEPSRTSP